MAILNTPVEAFKWVVKRGATYTLYAGDSKGQAGDAVRHILNNPNSKVKEIRVYYCGRQTFRFERLENNNWKAIEL